jgi:prolipoprotein diacylglyceryl transferase
MFEHNISPIIATFGRFSLRYYSLLFLCAFLLGLYLLNKVFEGKGIDTKYVQPLFITIFICVIVGARLGHVFFYRPRYFLTHPLEIIKFWKGGLASHGAAIFIIIGVVIFTRIYPVTFYQAADSLSIPISIGTSFVRLGNFFNSEIVGRVTTLPWGVKFLRYREPGNAAPQYRHPSQLYEMCIGIVVFLSLWIVFKKKKDNLQDGFLLYLFMLLYFSLRFLVEFVKETSMPAARIPLTTGQFLSIPFVLFSAFMLFVKGKARTVDDNSL